MLLAEVLLRLAHLGALQVAHLDGDFVERAAEDGQRGDVGGVPVALDDLRGHRRGLEAQPRADAFFVLRLQMAERAHRARQLAHAHVLGRGVEAGSVALHLGVPVEQLEAEGGGLGVDAVGAADGGRVLELDGAALEHGQQRGDAVADERRGFFDLQRLRRVDDVVRREPVVQPARLGVEALVLQALGHCSGEGDDVVLDLGLDLLRRARRRRWPWWRWPRRRRPESRRLRPAPCSPPTPLAASSDTCSLPSRCGPSPGACSVRSRQVLSWFVVRGPWTVALRELRTTIHGPRFTSSPTT